MLTAWNRYKNIVYHTATAVFDNIIRRNIATAIHNVYQTISFPQGNGFFSITFEFRECFTCNNSAYWGNLERRIIIRCLVSLNSCVSWTLYAWKCKSKCRIYYNEPQERHNWGEYQKIVYEFRLPVALSLIEAIYFSSAYVRLGLTLLGAFIVLKISCLPGFIWQPKLPCSAWEVGTFVSSLLW